MTANYAIAYKPDPRETGEFIEHNGEYWLLGEDKFATLTDVAASDDFGFHADSIVIDREGRDVTAEACEAWVYSNEDYILENKTTPALIEEHCADLVDGIRADADEWDAHVRSETMTSIFI